MLGHKRVLEVSDTQNNPVLKNKQTKSVHYYTWLVFEFSELSLSLFVCACGLQRTPVSGGSLLP